MLTKTCIFLIKGYKRFISPALPSACRFYPTCSEYSLESFERCGFVKGIAMSLSRVLKCHQFHPGGYDPALKEK